MARPTVGDVARSPVDAFHAAHLIARDYRNAYLSPGGLKQTWATHPERVVQDASMLLTAGEGGLEGLAARLPEASAAARVASGAARTARGANYVVNPAAGAGALVSKGTQIARGGPAVVNGEFTPNAQRAAAKANISPADLQNPNFKPHLARTLTAKGNTPDAAREAVVTYHGTPQEPAPAPMPTVTQRAPPSGHIAEGVDRARGLAHTAIDNKVDNMVGKGPPPTEPYSSAVDTWKAGRMNAVKTDGAFDPAKTSEMVADPAHPDRALFSPTELSDLNLAANGKAILDAEPGLGERMAPSWVGRIARAGVGAGATAAVGAGLHALGASDLLHMIPGAGLVGGEFGLGALGEQFFDPYFAKLAEKRTLTGGAPVHGGWAAPIEAAGAGADIGARTAPFLQRSGALPPTPPPPEERAGPANAPPAAPDLSTTPGVDQSAPATPEKDAPVDLSTVPGIDEEPPDPGALQPESASAPPPPPPEPERKAERPRAAAPAPAPAAADGGVDLSQVPLPQAAGGAVGYADGGKVVSLTDRLMSRAEREGKASRAATKPLLGLDDATVVKALALANRGL